MKISIFCGSRSGNNPVYEQAARELAAEMIQRQHTLVYGGGSIGIMGIIADEMIRQNGTVIGVLPTFFNIDAVGHKGISEMIFCQSMSERKTIMAEISDAFIALPGGFGTLDEFFEMLVNSQLHLHEKAVGLLNTNNFYQAQIEQLKTMVKEGFLFQKHFNMLICSPTVKELMDKIEKFDYQQDLAWIEKVTKTNG